MQLRGVEERDDRDREEVVDDGQGQQERAQRGRQGGADDGEHGQGKRDLGRGRDRPSGEVPAGAGVDRDEHRGREHHAADGGRDGKYGEAEVPQVAGDELTFELQAGDKKKIASRPSAAHWAAVRSRCSAAGPIRNSDTAA